MDDLLHLLPAWRASVEATLWARLAGRVRGWVLFSSAPPDGSLVFMELNFLVKTL